MSGRPRKHTEVTVYKGDTIVATGTYSECAEELGVEPNTIRFYTTPAHARRVARAKRPERCVVAVKLDE